MQESNEERLCSIVNCPLPAVHIETGETQHWRVAVFYCDEHQRELDEGTPLGPVGVDPARVEVTPKGAAEPCTRGRWEMSPH